MNDADLIRNAANFAPLTPLGFIQRSAAVYPERLAIVHGAVRRNWRETYARCRQLASALAAAGVGKGDTVAVMLQNTPAMVEVHFGVPMTQAVLNTLNTRLDAEALAFMLDHAEARVVLVDREFSAVMRAALAKARQCGRSSSTWTIPSTKARETRSEAPNTKRSSLREIPTTHGSSRTTSGTRSA